MAALPSNLTYGTVTGNVLAILPDQPDGDALPNAEAVPLLKVTLTPMRSSRWVPNPTATKPTLMLIAPYTLESDVDGDLVNVASSPAEKAAKQPTRVVATDDAALGSFVYRLVVSSPSLTDERAFTGYLEVPAGATVDITQTVPENPSSVSLPEWVAVIAQAQAAVAAAGVQASAAAASAAAAAQSAEDAEEAAGAYVPPAASETVAGIVELATNVETTTGTSTSLAAHPAGVAAALAAFELLKRPVRNRCVIVGSSNATKNGTNTWGAKLCSLMGWVEHNYAIGGTAYTTAGAGQNFQGQLTTAYNALTATQRAEVGVVFICDASNDGRAMTAYGTVKASATSAYNYARSAFPTARVIVIPMIWPSDTERYWPAALGTYGASVVAGMSRVVDAQRDAADAIGRVEFVDDTWTWLTGRDEYMTAVNNVHPGVLGHTLIANYLYAWLNGGNPVGRAGWVPPTMLGGTTRTTGEGSPIAFKREGWNVMVDGQFDTAGATSADFDALTAPYGFRPSRNIRLAFQIPGSSAAQAAHIYPNGTLRIRPSLAGSSRIYITGTYPIG